jgi:catechol 2,3-dioxygenase-like lactoylglutathione lyase family enzyme
VPEGASLVHHVGLRTDAVATLCAFYERWFGLRRVRETPTSVWLGLGDGGVLMIEAKHEDEPAIDPRTRELLAFRGSSGALQALEDQLRALGLLEDRTAHTLYFRDPDGRRVAWSCHPLGG